MKRDRKKSRKETEPAAGSENSSTSVRGQQDNPPAGESESGINWKLVDRIAKLFVVALILLLTYNVVQSMLFLPTSEVENQRKSVRSEILERADRVFADFTAGSWKFGAMEWNLRVYPETDEIGLLDPPSVTRQRSDSFDDQKFIDMLTKLGAEPQQIGDEFLLWQSQNVNGFPLVLFTRDGVVQAMRTRCVTQSGRSVVEGRPNSGSADDENVLMPIAAGINQVASRVDAKGRLTSAILKFESEFEGDIRAVWKEHGWEVTPMSDFANAISQLNAERYRCQKDDELVEATFFLDSHSQPDQIVLNSIRTASD